jgi:hypothetical protein
MQDFPKKYKSDYDALVLRQRAQNTKKISGNFTTLLYTPYNVSQQALGRSIYADVLCGMYTHQSMDQVRHSIFMHGNG